MMVCSSEASHSMNINVLQTVRSKHKGWKFADNIFNHISFKENIHILIQNFLNFVCIDPTDNISALVQVMAWHRTGAKPIPETMMTQ